MIVILVTPVLWPFYFLAGGWEREKEREDSTSPRKRRRNVFVF